MTARGLLSCALALAGAALSVARASGLDDARLALQRGDVAAAVEGARAAVIADPTDGRAYLFLGQALFAAEHYEAALDAFDHALEAGRPSDAGTALFNRAAVLFHLGRLAEAEAAYVAAARDEKLAPLALVNAGFAALEQRELGRARDHARRARALPGAAQLGPELAELERDSIDGELEPVRDRARAAFDAGEYAAAASAYEEALAAAARAGAPPELLAALSYAAGVCHVREQRWDQARPLLRDAAARDPSVGEYQFMAARAAFALGDDAAAEREFRAALDAGVDDETRAATATYLEAIAGPERSPWLIQTALSAGWDSNVVRVGTTADVAPSGGSPLLSLLLGVTLSGELGGRVAGHAGYRLEQLYYPQSGFDEFNLQEHALGAGLELEASRRLRLRVMVEGAALFAGVTDFGPRLVEPRGVVGATLRIGGSTTRLELEYAMPRAWGNDAYEFLSGARTEVRLAEELRLGAAAVGVRVGFYDASLGTERPSFDGLGECRTTCTSIYVIPHAYRAPFATLRARLARGRWRGEVEAGLEARSYREESYLEVTELDTGVSHEENRVRREDLRISGGARVSVALGRGFELGVRLDWLRSESNVDGTSEGPTPDYDDLDYDRIVTSAELSREW